MGIRVGTGSRLERHDAHGACRVRRPAHDADEWHAEERIGQSVDASVRGAGDERDVGCGAAGVIDAAIRSSLVDGSPALERDGCRAHGAA